ncbi:hypothetical protein CSB45_13955 [candidate division KSB3 bacterium]|uniref:Pilus assembly protein PilB n=1 Tax=candidate division KSB3 bacterium TaxID=2044937 RepID=A0A2G6E2G0_9BACT|nr:MAG: hypothetical protein CSB45_13955 [candidate division KSB3 bacterium]PIE28490.1 MAG: hypothetical protein CSA57_13365 [candidate division KSB3 bacterium]
MKHNKSIGSILLDVELVSQKDIEQALEIQKQRGQRLGEVLVQLGVVSDDDIRWALAEQLNLPYVNIRKDQVDVDVATLLPEKLARRYHVIPILKIDNELTIVVDDPLNTTVIKDIERITKSEVKISLGRTSDILLAIDEIYGLSEAGMSDTDKEMPPQFLSPWFQEDAIQKILNDPSGQVLTEQIFLHALQHGVSRIYFQPGERCHVSYRINGVLQEQLQLNTEWYAILLFRLKIYADLEMATLRRPQDREFSFQLPLEDQDATIPTPTRFVVSMAPTESGEAAVVSVIHKSPERLWAQLLQNADSQRQERELAEMYALQTEIIRRKTGAILLGGAQLFDKAATLYAMMGKLDPLRQKIVTLERHTEYRAKDYYQISYAGAEPWAALTPVTADAASLLSYDAPSVSQARVRHQTGFELEIQPQTQQQLSAWLNAVGSCDTDVMLVDHIESESVLFQCLDFAGHGLLFASLDFPNVYQLLMYLRDCRVKASVLSSRVHALVAQQSVRQLCQECKQPDSSEQAAAFLTEFSRQEDDELYRPQGCPSCHMSGYTQRLVLYEILCLEAWLQELLLNGAPLRDIQASAEKRGFHSLRKKAVELLLSGDTSLEEAYPILL